MTKVAIPPEPRFPWVVAPGLFVGAFLTNTALLAFVGFTFQPTSGASVFLLLVAMLVPTAAVAIEQGPWAMLGWIVVDFLLPVGLFVGSFFAGDDAGAAAGAVWVIGMGVSGLALLRAVFAAGAAGILVLVLSARLGGEERESD